MLTYILTLLTGAYANRLRGGGVISENSTFFGTQKRRIIYCFTGALVFALAHAELQGASWDGVPYYLIGGETLIRALAVFVVLFAAHLTGWGRPIGAVGGWEDKPLEEFKPLDYLTTATLTKFKLMPVSKRRGQALNYVTTKRLRLWGLVWLTYWGLATGVMLALATGSLLPILSFGVIGVAYYTTFSAYKALGKQVGGGWPTAEWIFGAVSFIGLL